MTSKPPTKPPKGQQPASPITPSVKAEPSVTVVPKDQNELPPLGPAVFGKFAFFITVVPFIFYLAGGMFASYVETARAHSCVKQQTHNFVMVPLMQTKEYLAKKYESEPGGFQRYWNGWNLEAIEFLIGPEAEEEFTAEKLDELLVPIREVSEPEFDAKVELRQQLLMLQKMKQLEQDHKTREILTLSHSHFSDLESEDGGELDSEKIATDSATSDSWFPPDKTWYPTTYTITIVGTALLMLLAFPGYFKAPFKITIWSVIVGVVGIFVWILLVEVDRRYLHIGEMLAPGGRDAFDPFKELKSNPTWMWQFMAIRFTGLVLIVPFIEEFFLRGWLMRYIDDPDWDYMPLAEHGQLAIIGVVGYAVVSHLGEPLAAAAWFGMVTWLFLKTKSVWDCVVAHAITNLLLGIFVVYTGSWYLW